MKDEKEAPGLRCNELLGGDRTLPYFVSVRADHHQERQLVLRALRTLYDTTYEHLRNRLEASPTMAPRLGSAFDEEGFPVRT